MKKRNLMVLVFVALAAIALAFVPLLAKAWEKHERVDEFDGSRQSYIAWDDGDQLLSVGCYFEGDEVGYFTIIDFGSFSFVGSKGRPKALKVRFGAEPVEDATGFYIRQSDGSVLERMVFDRGEFEDYVNKIEGGAKYRVTAYNTSRYTIAVPPIPDRLSADILRACG